MHNLQNKLEKIKTRSYKMCGIVHSKLIYFNSRRRLTIVKEKGIYMYYPEMDEIL